MAGLGESEVLRRILARLGEARAARVGPGDDCAVLGFTGEAVVTTDTMIEGPDFRLAWHSGYELGWKLAATNLSDIASMGARPVALTVALACPAETPIALLERAAAGPAGAGRALAPGGGGGGGARGRARVLAGAVAALGDLEGRPAVLRSGARPDDVLAYAGELGLAGSGLSLLFAESADGDLAHSRGLAGIRERNPAALAAQLTPRPPIGLGTAAAGAGATAMMDVSDGLALDASRLARASRCRVLLDSSLLLAGFSRQAGEPVLLEAMLFGGEDHGLLAAFPPGATLPVGFERIGMMAGCEPEDPEPTSSARVLLDGAPLGPRGWDPFAGRAA